MRLKPQTSLPGYIPWGPVFKVPKIPSCASRSRFGVRAASSGVFPPSSGTGQSPNPSGTITAYFILVSIETCFENFIALVNSPEDRDLFDPKLRVLTRL